MFGEKNILGTLRRNICETVGKGKGKEKGKPIK